jgi:hypothetical protein
MRRRIVNHTYAAAKTAVKNMDDHMDMDKCLLILVDPYLSIPA